MQSECVCRALTLRIEGCWRGSHPGVAIRGITTRPRNALFLGLGLPLLTHCCYRLFIFTRFRWSQSLQLFKSTRLSLGLD